MKQRDAAIMTVIVGTLALYVVAADKVTKYLRPTMAPYVLLTAVVLIASGIAGLVLLKRPTEIDDDQGTKHEHKATRTGWLLLLPAVVGIIVNPGTFGAWGAGRASSPSFAMQRDFDLDAYLRTQELAGGRPSMKMVDLVWAARGEGQRAALARIDIEVVGFVSHDNADPDGVIRLNRFVMGCCAADATPLQLVVQQAPQLSDDTWVRMTVRYLPQYDKAKYDDSELNRPTVRAVSIDRIDEPSEPFEYLF